MKKICAARKSRRGAAIKMNLKKFLLPLFSLFLLAVGIPSSYAHCPLCTAAVGAAAISAKYYGVNLSILGLLVGAFAISTGLWLGLRIKQRYFKFQLLVIALASFLLTIVPVAFAVESDSIYLPVLLAGPSGSLLNKVYWVNKLAFGSVLGGLITLFAFWLHTFIKKANGRVLFPFQGVALTIFLLALSGMALYFAMGA